LKVKNHHVMKDWAKGVYVWKVMIEGKEVETGKWMKK
jgi:hypothetical protein